jgi:hypothetical protein
MHASKDTLNKSILRPLITNWALIGFLCLLVNNVFAQLGTYQRKSISYVDVLLYTAKARMLPPPYERYLLDAIHQNIRLNRFDYNPLPENLQHDFRQVIAGRSFTDEELGQVIASELGPTILKVLDVEKEARAQSLVTETQRNSFIVLKAKEMGITAEQLEQVLNSAYLYVPYIINYKLKEPKKDEKEYIAEIEIGLIYYHLIAGDEPQFEKIIAIHSSGMATAEKGKDYQVNDRIVAPEDFAFYNAAQTVALNLQIKTREIASFRLQAPIAAIERRTIYFPLGRQEGIRLDEPFYVGEYYQRPDGKLKFRQSGFVRVSQVADKNKPGKQLSQAYAIKKGDWAKGMTIKEHPRLPLDLAFKPRGFELTVKEGIFASDDFLIVFQDSRGTAVGFDFDIQYNIAELTRKRQAFMVLGGTFALAPVDCKVYNSFVDFLITPPSRSVAPVVNGYLGYLRRFYLGPFAIHFEGLVGAQALILSDTYKHENVNINNYSAGARINLGLEYALNIDTNIGLFAGFSVFPPMDWWTIKYKDKEVDVENYTGYNAPRIYSIGPTVGFYIHYTPPTLGVNPMAMVESQVKKQINK